MLKINLTKILTLDETINILEKEFPLYTYIKKSNYILIKKVDNQKDCCITISDKMVTISPYYASIFLILIGLTVIFFPVFYYYYNISNKENIPLANYLKEQCKQDISILIPNTCPHCKNPNSKLVRECEWCGNQII
jgi:hypothetical protein